LGVIFIIELAVGIAAIAFRTDLKDFLNMKLQKSMNRRNEDDMMAWSTVQQRMMCCGIDGPKNWYDNNNQTIPSSCCRPLYIDQTTNDCAKSEALFIHRYYQVHYIGSKKLLNELT
jgi:CD63 antigen